MFTLLVFQYIFEISNSENYKKKKKTKIETKKRIGKKLIIKIDYKESKENLLDNLTITEKHNP